MIRSITVLQLSEKFHWTSDFSGFDHVHALNEHSPAFADNSSLRAKSLAGTSHDARAVCQLLASSRPIRVSTVNDRT